MPLLALFTGKLTREQYDAMRVEVGWDSKHPAGNVFHAASFDEEGNIHVAEIWESPEQLNAFAQTVLMPAFAKNNLAPPSVSVYPTYLVQAYEGLDNLSVKT